MLEELQETRKLTYLFIAHDLAIVKHISTRIGVMYLGHMVELAESAELYRNPIHPYTEMLLSCDSDCGSGSFRGKKTDQARARCKPLKSSVRLSFPGPGVRKPEKPVRKACRRFGRSPRVISPPAITHKE